MSKDMDFWSLVRNLSGKYGIKLLNTATKTGLVAVKTTSKN